MSEETGRSGTGRSRTGPPNLLTLLEGPRALAEASSLIPALPLLLSAPKGDGHPVMVLPGLMGSDESTRILRLYLRRRGYAAHPWSLGRNLGLPDGLRGRLRDRVLELFEQYERRLSLVGWSLGGIYARELARAMPEQIRQVITLGSPFGGEAQGARPDWLHRMVFGEDLEPEARRRLNQLAEPPPVPATAIFSRSDGIAPWRACREKQSLRTDNIEVLGSHCGLGFNPLVLYAVADRLALPEDDWRPFERTGLWSLLYA